jgi:periplasmic mercuric ion binding protein
MKTVKFIGFALLGILYSISVSAQTVNSSKTTKSESIKVSGNCGMCKARIENAAKVDGVSKAEWNQDSKILTLVYDTTKVNCEAVQKKIAAVGHDTEKFKAVQTAYDQLPGCCKYR